MAQATFETINTKDMWKDIVQIIIDHRKKIIKRSFSTMDGIYSIRYDFSDTESIIIPLQTLEYFLSIS